MSIPLDGFNPIQNIAAILLNNGLMDSVPNAVLVSMLVAFTLLTIVVSGLVAILPLLFKGKNNNDQ